MKQLKGQSQFFFSLERKKKNRVSVVIDNLEETRFNILEHVAVRRKFCFAAVQLCFVSIDRKYVKKNK